MAVRHGKAQAHGRAGRVIRELSQGLRPSPARTASGRRREKWFYREDNTALPHIPPDEGRQAFPVGLGKLPFQPRLPRVDAYVHADHSLFVNHAFSACQYRTPSREVHTIRTGKNRQRERAALIWRKGLRNSAPIPRWRCVSAHPHKHCNAIFIRRREAHFVFFEHFEDVRVHVARRASGCSMAPGIGRWSA